VEVPKPVATAAAANSPVAPNNSSDNFGDEAHNGDAKVNAAEPVSASCNQAPEEQSSSPLEALQRKFESHKVTPSPAAEKVR
jgi:hypothetical protein